LIQGFRVIAHKDFHAKKERKKRRKKEKKRKTRFVMLYFIAF